MSYAHGLWAMGFVKAIGSPHLYTAGSQDTNSRFVASLLLYGRPMMVPLPDLDHVESLVILGANPAVSHGSLLSVGRIHDALHAITERGGEVLVIDPRRNETAREFDWLPITPDSDAWLLLSILNVLFEEGWADQRAMAEQAAGHLELRALAADFPPEVTAARTGIPPERVPELAVTLATRRSALYGRTGTCLGSYATLVCFLMDAVNLVAGNLDRRGGAVFGQAPLPVGELLGPAGLGTYDSWRSRIGGLPEVLGVEPAALIADEITTPGEGLIRALFVSAGNPVLSAPGGEKLVRAFGELDLMVSLDRYVNETNEHADYILPAVAMYEREDLPVISGGFFTKLFLQATEAVVPPPGEARPEWQVIDELARALGTRALALKSARLVATSASWRASGSRRARLWTL